MHEAEFVTPLWYRAAVHDANLVPAPELREHVRKQAELLPHVLSGRSGSAQAQRENLLTMHVLCERLVLKRRMIWVDGVSVRDLRTAIRAEAAALPAVLDRASEPACQHKFGQMSNLCRHLLALMLSLLLFGGCPICNLPLDSHHELPPPPRYSW